MRLFVALELPSAVREALERWRVAALRGHDALRAVAPEALHATLCFLGWLPAPAVQGIGAACVGALSDYQAPRLSLGDAVWLPRRRPRVLAVKLTDPSEMLARLQASVSSALCGGGWYVPEKRPFFAHVTVARVAGGARVRATELRGPPRLEFPGASIVLYRSQLGRGGARYEPLRKIDLPSAE